MPRFSYQVRDTQGELGSGVVAASTMEEASKILRGEGKFVIKLNEVGEEGQDNDSTMSIAQHARRVRRSEVIFFAHQMSIMIDTGVPIVEGLESMTEQTGSRHFRVVLKDVMQHVQSGNEFSAALERHPKVFPPIMISLIRAGEFSGTMGTMLTRVSEYLSKEAKIFRQARGALMYPTFMFVMAIAVVVFLLTVILPKFATIYADRGATLPWPTRFLLGASEVATTYWPAWCTLFAVGVIGTVVGLRTDTGKRALDWLKLHIPLVRFLFTQLYLTRGCRTLGTMTSAGVSLLDTIEIVRQVTRNKYYEDLWDDVDDALRQGLQLSEPLFKSSLIPRPVVQMIRSGEKSGRIGDVTVKIAEFTEAEFDQTVKTVTQMLEPIMICFMGGVVGFVAVALLMPIFTISKVVAG